MNTNQGDNRLESKQDNQLDILWKNQRECTIITTNGVHLKGVIEAFDKFVVVIRDYSGKQSMIYKHALSTIIAK